MCMGTHFPLGGHFGGYAFQLHLPRLPSYLEPHLDLWKLFLGFCSIYLFNHLKIFLTPSPFSLHFSLAVCVQQDFVHSDLELLFGVWEAAKHHEWAWSVVCGHCSSWKGSKGLLGLVIGVQGVFSPGSVISALGFDQHRLPSPLTHHCAVALPWIFTHSWSPSFPKSERRQPNPASSLDR